MTHLILLLTAWIDKIQSTNSNFIIPGLQYNGLHFIACLLVCKTYRLKNKFRRYWLESLVCVFILRFGGTMTMALLLGQPPSWMLAHSAPFSLYLAWWLTFCSPGDCYWNYISNNKLIFEVVAVFDAISQGMAITSWGMDKALFNNFHNNSETIGNALILNIMCGVVSSNGGSILADYFGFYEARSFLLNKQLTLLSAGADGDVARVKMTKCFLLACLYYAVMRGPRVIDANWYPLELSERKLFGHMLVCGFQIVDLLQLKFLPPSINVFGFIGKGLLRFLLIPRVVQDTDIAHPLKPTEMHVVPVTESRTHSTEASSVTYATRRRAKKFVD